VHVSLHSRPAIRFYSEQGGLDFGFIDPESKFELKFKFEFKFDRRKIFKKSIGENLPSLWE